jgi:hypothetical protein
VAVRQEALTNERISAMKDPKIVNGADEEIQWEVSDEELEAASGIGKAVTLTLYNSSYCFACPS